MGSPAAPPLSWSIRHRGSRQHADRVFAQLGEYCGELLRDHLPHHSGYETSVYGLSGALDGTTITVRRGNFRGVVSIQRYPRNEVGPPPSDADSSPMELRVIAIARHEPAPADGRALARFGVVGCAFGTMGFTVLGVELAGILSAWAQLILIVPALMAWKICCAARSPDSGTAHDRPALSEVRRREAARTRAHDLNRWRRVLEALARHHERVTDQFALRPFRSPGSAAWLLQSQRADAPGIAPMVATVGHARLVAGR